MILSIYIKNDLWCFGTNRGGMNSMALVKCPDCGKEISSKADKCPNCGYPVEDMVQKNLFDDQPDTFNCSSCGRPIPVGSQECMYCGHQYTKAPVKKIICPECGSTNVDITFVQSGAHTNTKNVGAPTTIGRKFLKVATLGLWGFTGARKSHSTTNFRNDKMAVCKDCGHSWYFLSEKEAERYRLIIFIIITIIVIWFIYK